MEVFFRNIHIYQCLLLHCVTQWTLRKSRNFEISIVKNPEYDTFFREFQQIMSKMHIAHQMAVMKCWLSKIWVVSRSFWVKIFRPHAVPHYNIESWSWAALGRHQVYAWYLVYVSTSADAYWSEWGVSEFVYSKRLYNNGHEVALHNVVPRGTTVPRCTACWIICMHNMHIHKYTYTHAYLHNNTPTYIQC